MSITYAAVESCPECEEYIYFEEYGQIIECKDCKTKWQLDSQWDSEEGYLVDILNEVKGEKL